MVIGSQGMGVTVGVGAGGSVGKSVETGASVGVEGGGVFVSINAVGGAATAGTGKLQAMITKESGK